PRASSGATLTPMEPTLMSKSRRTSKSRSQSVEEIRAALDKIRAAIEQLPKSQQLELWRTLPYVQTLESYCCSIPRFMNVVDELQDKLGRKDPERLALEDRVRQARALRRPRKQIAKQEGISIEDVDSIIYNKRKSTRRVEHSGQTSTY